MGQLVGCELLNWRGEMKRKTKSSLITKYSPVSNRGGKTPLVGLNGVFDPDSFFMLVCHEASFIHTVPKVHILFKNHLEKNIFGLS